MKFEFNAKKENYEHLAAGRVLLSKVGMTSFPVRLASEIFQQCYAYLGKEKLNLYDPCCGTAYLLTTIGFLHHEAIAAIYASDIQLEALEIGRKNLALLSEAGLEARREELERLYAAYGKEFHAEALASIEILREQLPKNVLDSAICLGDAMQQSLAPKRVDLLICDVPYGEKVAWESASDEPIFQLLEAQYPILAKPALAVIISDKKQKIGHPKYRRYKHWGSWQAAD